MGYVNKDGMYYIGDRQGDDLEVSDRPSLDHEWVDDEWVINDEKYIKTISDAIQVILDTEAQAAGYDSILTAVTYADEPVVIKFSDDGKSFRKWRSKVWEYYYAALANAVMPTIEDITSSMPKRV
jgi:hypothetical protein